MWTVLPLLMSFAAAQPAPEAYVRVGCPFMPVNFENGSREIGDGSREILAQTARNFIRSGQPPPQVVLRIFTEPHSQRRDESLLAAQADAVRQVLIENGFAPDHILIDHGEGESHWPVPQDWRGTVIETEYFLPRGEPRPATAPEPPIC